ncbi:hypothetical protein D3C78_906480 [compost metagenome]
MQIFKDVKEKVIVYQTRAFVEGVSYEEATLCLQSITWDQCHFMKQDGGLVDVSLILGKKVADELHNFIHEDDDPEPQYA